jgi:hypothetical protein
VPPLHQRLDRGLVHWPLVTHWPSHADAPAAAWPAC